MSVTQRHLGLVCVLAALGSLGCATPQQRQAKADWALLCAHAPHGAGQAIDTQEQRAMHRLQVWHLSVEALDQRCRP